MSLVALTAACGSKATPEAGHVASHLLPAVAAAGSTGPNLARGADGTLVLSWIEPAGEGHSLRYSRLDGTNWTVPRTVASGDNWFVNWADFPSVVPISDTLWGAHWLVSRPAGGYAYDVHTAVSTDRGNSWSESIVPHTDKTDTEHGFVTLFPHNGRAGIVWLDGRKMVNEYDDNDVGASGTTLRAADINANLGISNEALVDDLTCDCCQTDVAITSNGPLLAYRDRTEDEFRDIYVAQLKDGQWQSGKPVASDDWEIAACPVNGPVVQANGETVAVAWFTGAGEKPLVKMAWSRDAGQTFSDPVEVSSERPLGHVGAVLLEQGDLVITWLHAIGRGGAELMLRRIKSNGEMGAPFVLTEANDVFAFSVPQISSVGDTLVVAWTTEANKKYGVASATIPESAIP